jgi:alpha-L-rhamnosidase
MGPNASRQRSQSGTTVIGTAQRGLRLVVRTIALVLVFSCAVHAQSPAGHDWAAERWKAQWIAWPEAPQRDTGTFHFRKAIQLSVLPHEFIVHVSADNRFLLFVNGTRVGEGPASSDLGHWKYETFDLRPFLRQGSNVIAATVWNFGTLAPVAQMTSRAGFVLQGNSASEEIANTDESWDVEIEQGHEPSRVDFMALMKTYYAGPPGEIIDGRKYDWNWNGNGNAGTSVAPWVSTGGVHDSGQTSHWRKAASIGPGAARPSQDTRTVWMLQPDPLPPMDYAAVPLGRYVVTTGFSPVSAPACPTCASGSTAGPEMRVGPHSTARLVLDAGALTTAYLEITVRGGVGARIRVTYAEAMVDDHGEKGNRNETDGRHMVGLYDEFIADGGDRRVFAPLIWRTWRYLQIEIATEDQDILLADMKAYFTAYPFHETARFSSDDADLGKIWEVSWRTARLCSHETYMDTPYYERLQYVGDTRIQTLISYTVGGDDRLARQAIDAIDNSRITDGITTSRYPSQLPQIIPTFSLMWVGMVRDFSMYRDDPAFVGSHLGGTRTVLDWFMAHQRPDGLIGKLPWWPFVDWTKDFHDGVPPQDPDGGSAPITLQLIEALRDAADLETRFGEPARAAMYSARANKAAEAALRLCWDEKTGLLADTPAKAHFSQHANALGIWLDVIPQSRQKDVMEKILGTDADVVAGREPRMSDASYYFRFYLARALEHAGMADEYVATLHPWRRMLQLGLTTWAETPEPTRSDSHAWSAHPNYDLLRLVAGIRPGAPSFAEIVIEPHLGGLKKVDAAMPHPRGMIEVALVAADRGGTSAKIVVPQGVPARLIWRGRTYPLRAGEQTLQLP